MMFADRQDVGLPRDSHFHGGRSMLASVVVDLIPYTCRAGKTPRPAQSGHGSRVGLLLPKPVRQAFHYVAHPERPATTVRQSLLPRPLVVPQFAGTVAGAALGIATPMEPDNLRRSRGRIRTPAG